MKTRLTIKGVDSELALELKELAIRKKFPSTSTFIRHILVEYVKAPMVKLNESAQSINEAFLLDVIERNTTVLEIIREELNERE